MYKSNGAYLEMHNKWSGLYIEVMYLLYINLDVSARRSEATGSHPHH